MTLRTAILGLRNDPRILRLPPYLSFICMLVGIAWLLVIPLNEYSRRTYISENALLPGQVHTYFGGSEHNVFRAYRYEVSALIDQSREKRIQVLGDILKSHGLKVASQKYSYEAAGSSTSGENVYAILQGPRADATEAIVLIAAWRNMNQVLNQSGVALVLTLARYFKRWSLWSKDIIFIITEDSTFGPQAWVDAYHSTHDPARVASLSLKAGALQGAVAIDYPAGTGGHRFDKLHIVYDGTNGQLPNLDLINTVVTIASGHMGMSTTIQRMWKHDDSYAERMETLLRGMLVQGVGAATGPHSSFIPYHVDAVTLQTVGDGWQDEMSLGRVVESTFRSLNNLLEHLHQSFFFYLLMNAQRFVSIGTYLPSAMLVAVNFIIMAIALWIQSGRPVTMPSTSPAAVVSDKQALPPLQLGEMQTIEHGNKVAIVPKVMLATEERKLLFPVGFVCTCHFLGVVPLYLFNNAPAKALANILHLTSILSSVAPLGAAAIYTRVTTSPATREQPLTLIPMLSLLLLSTSLSTLSTLNFSLGLLTGLLAAPLTLVHSLALTPSPAATDTNTPPKTPMNPSPAKLAPSTATTKPSISQRAFAAVYLLILLLISPTSTLYLASAILSASKTLPSNTMLLREDTWSALLSALPTSLFSSSAIQELLVQASEAWSVSGTWTALVLWVVWWPAWVVGVFCTAVRLLG